MKYLWKTVVSVIAVGFLCVACSAPDIAPDEAQAPADTGEEAAASRLAPSNVEFDLKAWGMRPLWRQNAVQRSRRKLQDMHATDRFLVMEATDNTVMLVDAETGALRGGTQLRTGLDQAPVDLNDQEILLVVSGVFYRLNVETNELSEGWRMSITPYGTPLVHGEHVVAADATGRVASMDIEERKHSWRAHVGGVVRNTPLLIEGNVYAAGFRGELLALGVLSGEERWSWKPPEPAMLSTGIAVRDNMLYVGDLQGYVYALTRETANVKWQQIAELGLTGQPLAQGDKVLFRSARPAIICMDVDAEGDKVAWKKDGVTDIITTSDSRVYVRHGGDKISALELETGEVIWTDRLLPGTHVTGGSPGQGVLYVADRTGAAVAFGEL